MCSTFYAEKTRASEWKVDPSLVVITQYNDNVRMRADQDDPQDSTGYALAPGIVFSGEELNLWDMSIDAKGKVTRFQDVEDVDSENIFFIFNGGRKTELTEWRLNTSYENNSTFDTDYETQPPVAGLLDDRTDRTSVTVAPSVRWILNETSQLSFSLNSTNVSYDEITNLNFKDYDFDSAKLSLFWRVLENHQLGFTGSYSEYDSPDADFTWDNTELSIDYSYSLSQTAKLSLSVGGRILDSFSGSVVTTCVGGIGEFLLFNGTCPITGPVLGLQAEDRGTVTDISYLSESENSSHKLSGGRTVIPSSFGSAQEQRRLSYIYNLRKTERFSMVLILDAFEAVTLSGVDSVNDRTRYRVEPSFKYKLDKNWDLGFSYRYIEQNITNSDKDSVSNAVYLNLILRWPKLASTY